MGCQDLAVPAEVMQHVVRVESSFNPYAIGVVGARLVRQPKNLREALATVRMLDARGYNFSLGLAQVNRKNLSKYGLDSYEKAFQSCPNLQAGSRILAECYARAKGDWPRSFSCYYSGDFTTGFRHGYVQKVYASISSAETPPALDPLAIRALGSVAQRTAPGISLSPAARRMGSGAGEASDPGSARPDEAGSRAGPSTTMRVSPVGQAPDQFSTDRVARVAQTPPTLVPNPADVPAQMQGIVDSAFVF